MFIHFLRILFCILIFFNTPRGCDLCRYRERLNAILSAMKTPYLEIQELANNVVRMTLMTLSLNYSLTSFFLRTIRYSPLYTHSHRPLFRYFPH